MSWTPLHARLHQVLRSRQLAPKGQRLLVAVSGGQDSLCLIRLLLDLQPKWDWQLAIAHCNHRWRSDADANAAYVEGLAQTWHIPYYGLTIEDDQRAETKTEAGARTWRYQVLTETAIAQGYGAIATGHTASDRAETLLYNLMRGSGTDGLQALAWQRSLPNTTVTVVRPLLFMTRRETGQFCQDVPLQPWIDATNDDWHYARNRIRQDLLPYLQDHFNPNVEHTLAQTAEILQADVAYLNTQADILWPQVVPSSLEPPTSPAPPHSTDSPTPPCSPDSPTPPCSPDSPTPPHSTDSPTPPHSPDSPTPPHSTDSPTPPHSTDSPTPPHSTDSPTPPDLLNLNRTILATAPLALQRRILRRCLLQILPKAPNFEHIEKLTALITAPNRSQTDPFPGGAIARVEGDWIVITRQSPTLF